MTIDSVDVTRTQIGEANAGKLSQWYDVTPHTDDACIYAGKYSGIEQATCASVSREYRRDPRVEVRRFIERCRHQNPRDAAMRMLSTKRLLSSSTAGVKNGCGGFRTVPNS